MSKNVEKQSESQFSESKTNEVIQKSSKETVENLESINETTSRVYFIRHGITTFEKNKKKNKEGDSEYVSQPSNAKLDQIGKETIKTTGKNLKKLGLNYENTMVFYADDTLRVEQTVDIICKQIFGKGLHQSKNRVKNNYLLSSTKKVVDKDGNVIKKKDLSRLMEDAIMFRDSVKMMAIIQRWHKLFDLNKKEAHSIKNILVVGHKSNKGGVVESVHNKDRGIMVDFDISHGEVIEKDIDMNYNYRRDEKERNILFINIHNYNSIITALGKKSEFEEQIQQFQSQELQIWELQNYINAYFRSNSELYKKNLLSDNYDLRIFCIANLIKNGEFGIVKENLEKLIKKEDERNMISLVETLLVLCGEDTDKKEEIITVLAESDNIPKGVKFDKLEFFAKYEDCVKSNIDFIRSKTLDEKLKQGENVIVPIGFQEEKHKTIEELVKSGNKILIEGEAGVGKSTKLLEIMEYLAPNDEEDGIKYFPVYINLGSTNYSKLKKEVRSQKGTLAKNKKIKFVYLFDALDESGWDEDTMKSFFERIGDIEGQVIITTRPNIINQEILDTYQIGQENYEYIVELPYQIMPLQIMEYKVKEIRDLLNYRTPLFLSDRSLIEKLGTFNFAKHDIGRVYIDTRNLSWEEIKEKIKPSDYGDKTVYIFENLTKSYLDNEEWKELFELAYELQNDNVKVIFTAESKLDGIQSVIEYRNCLYDNIRLNSINKTKKIERLKLNNMNIDQIKNYMELRLTSDEIEIFQEWRQNNFTQGLEFNPLMLSIICKLLKESDKKDILQIKNRTELYTRLVDILLWDWEKTKEKRLASGITINGRKEILARIALGERYNLHNERSLNVLMQIDEKIETYIPYSDETGYDFTCLNVLRRDNNGNYSFIHETIREYFSAMSYVNRLKESLEKGGRTLERLLEEQLIKSSFTTDPYYYEVNSNSMNFLCDMLDNKSKKQLVKAISDKLFCAKDYKPYSQVIYLYAFLLAKLDLDKAFDCFKYLLKLNKKLFYGIVVNMGIAGGKKIEDNLRGDKNSDDVEMRRVIVQIFGIIGGNENIEFIKQFVNDESHIVRLELLEKLLKIGGEENMNFIIQFTDEFKDEITEPLIWQIGRAGGKKNLEFLQTLEKKFHIVIKVLASIGGKKNIEYIKSLKNNESELVRQSIIEALGAIGGEENVEFIKKFSKDSNKIVRLTLKRVLRAIGGEQKFVDSFHINPEKDKKKEYSSKPITNINFFRDRQKKRMALEEERRQQNGENKGKKIKK